ncbi:MAG: virulence RhuM family protein [Salinivirgaceae bacterium]|nr:virulence RhuM family protein [Salinivirgaceae bacterium]
MAKQSANTNATAPAATSSSAFLIYQDDNGLAHVNVRFDGEDVWLTVEQIMELFDASQQDVSYHIRQIYADGEQTQERTHKKFLLVRQEGTRSVSRNISHYNLDMIIAVGYRVKSQVATRFRQWATVHLHEFIQKGFTLDDNRLKGNRSRYFRELLQRIRDIRSSERNLYQQVTDIFITSVDYNPNDSLTRNFFATVQNKLHYAAHQHTAAEVVYERVSADKPMVGMTNFRGDYITKDDVQIAKNYLTEEELTYLNLLVSQYLDFAEVQALQQIPMKMTSWIEKLDDLMKLSGRQLLVGNGTITHEEAKRKAIAEFERYRKMELIQYESDYDRAIRELIQKSNQPSAEK